MVSPITGRKPDDRTHHPLLGMAESGPTVPLWLSFNVFHYRPTPAPLARFRPCWPHSVGKRVPDPAAGVAERDHLLASHRIEVVLTDLADVGPGRGLDQSQTITGDSRDDASTIVRTGRATDKSLRFQTADLLRHSTRPQDRRPRQIFHSRRAVGRSDECIQNEEVGEGQVVQIFESSIQPLEKKRRRLEELFPALAVSVGESRQMMRRWLVTRLSHGGRRYRTRSSQYRRNGESLWDSTEALTENQPLQLPG
jgi:hypothetical protein